MEAVSGSSAPSGQAVEHILVPLTSRARSEDVVEAGRVRVELPLVLREPRWFSTEEPHSSNAMARAYLRGGTRLSEVAELGLLREGFEVGVQSVVIRTRCMCSRYFDEM